MIDLAADSVSRNVNPLSTSDSIGVGGAVALNDVRGGATAYIDHTTLVASTGNVIVQAAADATLSAHLESAVSSSGGSKFGAGTSLAAGGLIATNTVQGGAEAYVTNSHLTTAGTAPGQGNITVEAQNTSTIQALLVNAAQSTKYSIGATLAFNTIGWAPQNILFNTLDALIGSPAIAGAFGNEQGAGATARISDSTVQATGTLTVSATTDAEIASSIDNVSQSTSEAWFGAKGVSFGMVVAMNKVASRAEAQLTRATVRADGGTSVVATDRAHLGAEIVLEADAEGNKRADLTALAGAVSLNDVRGGATAFVETAIVHGGAVQVTATEQAVLSAHLASAASSDGSKRDSLAAGGLVSTNTVQGRAEAYVTSSTIGTSSDRVGGSVTVRATNSSSVDARLMNATESGKYSIGATLAFNTIGWAPQNILFNTIDALIGDPVLADDAFGGEMGAGAKAYLFDTTVDASGLLTVEATSGASLTADVANTSESYAHRFSGATGLSFGAVLASNKVSSKAAATIDWSASYAGAKTVTADGGVLVKATDSAAIGATITLIASSEASSTSPFADSDSYGIAGAVSLNDVRGGATAYIDGATLSVSAGKVTIEAVAYATINSSLDSKASSTGVNQFGGGSSIAVGALIATNTVQGGAAAYVTDSRLTTTGPGGDITANAVNTSTLKAATVNSATSEGISVAATLAFNTIGWEAQNILFNTVDAILGDPLISEAFGGETGAGAKAYLWDTTVDATGLLRVTATSSANLTADIRNQSVSDAQALTGTSGMSFGAVIALNKTSSKAEASIDWSDLYSGAKTITADGGVTVSATDGSSIDAVINLASDSISRNTNPAADSDSVGVAGAVALNDVRGGAMAYIDGATLSVNSGGVTVQALSDATLLAHLESAVSSSGGGKFGTGTSLAASGLIATNTVQNAAQAWILGATIGTPADRIGGDVTVDAQNTSTIDAILVNATYAGAQAIAVTLAFNTVGWAPQNILFNTIDALLGDPLLSEAFGANQGAGATARISDSTVDATGRLTVNATTAAQIGADVSNVSKSTSEAWTGAGGISFGALISMSKVSATAEATVGYSTGYSGGRTVTADGGVVVSASDNAAIVSNIDLVSASVSTSTNPFSNDDSIGLGFSVSMNDVRGGAEATVDGAVVTARHGGVRVTADETATLDAVNSSVATSTGGSIMGDGTSVAVSAVIATNLVLSSAEATVSNSTLGTAAEGVGGDVTVTADNRSSIFADVAAATESNGTSIGVTLAFNSLGWASQNILFNTIDALIGTDIGEEAPARTEAAIVDATVYANGAVTVGATLQADIEAVISATAVSIVKSLGDNTSISVGAVVTMNRLSTTARAVIDGAPAVQAGSGNVWVHAADGSTIDADVSAASVAVAQGVGDGTSVAVGLSISRNDIRNEVEAYVAGSGSLTTPVRTLNGNVVVEATEGAVIDATSTASAVAKASGASDSTAFAGGGASAVNAITGKSNAYLSGSTVKALGTGLVSLTAQNTSDISALVAATAESIAIGGNDAQAFAIGFSFAENVIGWKNLFTEYPLEVKAYIEGSTVEANGGLILDAGSTARIDATVAATAVAIAGSLGGGLALTGAGLTTFNRISTDIGAFVDASTITTTGDAVRLSALDSSAIRADGQAAAVAASLSGDSGGAVAIGLSLAHNEIDNGVAAYIAGSNVLTSLGAITLNAQQTGAISVTTTAAAVSAGISAGSTGVALSGGAAEATNRILGGANAYIETSTLGTASNKVGAVDIDAASTSTISAVVESVAASLAVGNSTAVGVALGVAVARNFIGWERTDMAADYQTGIGLSQGATLAAGDTVKITTGARAGDVYEYLGKDQTQPTATLNTDMGTRAVAPGALVEVKPGFQPGVDGADGNVGSIYKYQGKNTTSIDLSQADFATNDWEEASIDLRTQHYGDTSVWKLVNLRDTATTVQAYIADSSLQTSADLTMDAVSTQSIEAVVLSGAAALSGGGTTGIAVSGAGVYAENKIRTFVQAYTDGDGADGITARSVHLAASDSSSVDAIAGAASLAASVGGSNGISVSIGLSVALNEIGNVVAAYVSNADQGVKASTGSIVVSALTQNQHLFDLALGGQITAANLNDAATADVDNPDDPLDEPVKRIKTPDDPATPDIDEAVYEYIGGDDVTDRFDDDVNEGVTDADADRLVLAAIRAAFAAQDESLALFDTVAPAAQFTTGDGTQDVSEGAMVRLAEDYAGGGLEGRVYRYIVKASGNSENWLDLGVQNYTDTSQWQLVEKLKIAILVEGQSWTLTAPDGKTYVLELDETGTTLRVSRSTINAVSAAASLAAGIGGSLGIAVSGAGAVAQNVILTKTNAYGLASVLDSADDVSLSATSTANIASAVLAASLGIGGGGTVGVGASIGVSVACNFMGWTPGGSEIPAEVQAYLKNTSVRTTNDLTLTSLASQAISSVVFAGSAAIAIGGTVGVGASGSGVWAENKIGVHAQSFIEGDRDSGTVGISAKTITLTADDTSTIKALAGAASLAAAISGTVGVSFSIGVSLARNTITSDVAAYIKDADGLPSSATDYGVTATTANGITISATERAKINALSAAASLAAGFAGVVGVSISGAGADANNIILTSTKAYVQNSTVTSTGKVDIDAANTASIDAAVLSASASLAFGTITGVGASLGLAVARNYIGWDRNYAYDDTDCYLTGDNPAQIVTGDTVKIAAGPNAGNVYKYLGTETLTRPNGPAPEGETEQHRKTRQQEEANWLTRPDYSDKDQWELVNLEKNAAAVLAYLLDSSVVAGGAVTADAISDQTIDATVFAGSVAIAGGLVGGGLSGAGACAENRIATLVQASIQGDKDGKGITAVNIGLNAEDTSEIESFTGAVSIAASGGLVGISLSIGVGVAFNEIDNDVAAFVKDADAGVTGTVGDITIAASEDATIDATAAAASAAVAFGAVGASLSGAGASARNVILGGANAYVENSVVKSTRDVSLTADNQSTIKAEVVAASAAVGGGAFVGAGLSIGAAVARNFIGYSSSGAYAPLEVQAYTRDSSVDAGRDLKLTATSVQDIDAIVGSGSVAASAGGFAGIGLSGAGAVATNRVAANVMAYLDGTDPGGDGLGTMGVIANTISLTARDTSAIDATVGTASVGAGFGLVGAAVSVGVSLATNEVNNQVSAFIANAAGNGQSVKTRGGGDLTILAREEATIHATGVAASASISGGLVGVSFAGAGVDVTNAIRNKTHAYIANSAIGTSANRVGDIALSATDTSSIDATVGTLVGSLGVGAVSGAVAFGVTTASNLIGYTPDGDSDPAEVLAYVADSTIDALGALGLTADSVQTIGAVVIAGSVAVAGGLIAVGEAGAGASTNNRIRTLIKAFIDGDAPTSGAASGVRAASVSLSAEDASTISATVNAVSFAKVAGLGGADSVSASTAANSISNEVAAYVADAELTATGSLSITATESATVTSRSFAPSVASGLFGGADAAAQATNTLGNTTQALVQGSTATGGNVTVTASDVSTIQSFSGALASGVTGGLGGAVGYNVIDSTVNAHVLSSTVTATAGSIAVEALGSGTIKAVAAGAAGGMASGKAGTLTIQTVSYNIDALVDQSTLMAQDSVLVRGRWDGSISADGGAGSVGGFVGVGGTMVLNTLANNVSALIRRSAVTANGTGAGLAVTRWAKVANADGWQDDRLTTSLETIHGLAVIADSGETLDNALATSGSTGGWGLNVNKSVNLIGDITTASIGDATTGRCVIAAPAVIVRAGHDSAVTNFGGVEQGAGIGLVGGIDTTIVAAQTTATIRGHDTSAPTSVLAAGAVEVSAWAQDLVNSQTGSAGASALGAAGAVSAVEITSDTRAFVEQAELMTAGDLSVLATRIADAGTTAGALSTALLVGVGGAVDYVTIAGATEAYVTGASVDVAGDTSIRATSHALICGRSGTAGAGGIASVVGAASVHLIETVTKAYLGSGPNAFNPTMYPGQDVTIQAVDHAAIDSNAGSVGGSLIAGVGGSLDVGVIRNSATAEIGEGVSLQAGGDVTVDAQATQGAASYAKGYAIGLLAGIGGSISAMAIGGGLDDAAYDEADKVRDTINDLLDLAGGITDLTHDETSARVAAILAQHSLSIDAAITQDPDNLGAVRAVVGTGAQVTAGGNVRIAAKTTPAATADCGQVTGGIVAVGGSLATLDVAAPVAAVLGEQAEVTAGGDVTIAAESRPTFAIDVQTGDYSAIVGVGSARVVIGSDLSTQATVGQSAHVSAGGALAASALTVLDSVSALAHGTVGSMIAAGEVEVSATASLETLATIGLDAELAAGGDASVQARSEVTDVAVEATGGAGGLAGVGGAWAEFEFTTMKTEVVVGGFSELVAEGDVELTATALVDLSAFVSQDLGGVAAGAAVQAEVGTVMLTTVTVDDAATVSGRTVSISALADKIRGHATSDCTVKGLDAAVVSRTEVWYVVTTTVWIDWHATVAGRDAVNVLAQAGNMDAVTTQIIDCGSLAPRVSIKSYDHVDITTIAHLTGGAQLTTPTLTIYSNPVFGSQVYDKDAGEVRASGVFPVVDYDVPDAWTLDSSVEFYGDAVYVPVLSLHVDAAGNIDSGGGIPAQKDEANHEIVVDGFLYASAILPTAQLMAVGGTIAGTGRFLSGTPSDVRMVNESDYALRVGTVFAGAEVVSVDWFVTAMADDTSGFLYETDELGTSGTPRLHIESVGDVRLGGTISLPNGIVEIQTEGDVEDAVAGGGAVVTGWDTYLTAGGNLGSPTKPISVFAQDKASFLLQAVAGQDAWVSVWAFSYDPAATGVLLLLADLTAGGDMNLGVEPSSRRNAAGTWEPIPTTVQLSGQARAGGDFNLARWGTGVLQVVQPITAGDNVTLRGGEGSVYLQEPITATHTVTVRASQEIGGGPSQRITAHDVELWGRAVGGIGDATVKIDLTGGGLTAVADVDIGIRAVQGPLTVDYVFCDEGGVRLEVGDTAGDGDDIVFGPGAMLNVARTATLSAGDHFLLDSTAEIQAGQVILNLDAAVLDPDPGHGVEWTIPVGNFMPQASATDPLKILLNTGADDDRFTVAALSPDQALRIWSGAGNDVLLLGNGTTENLWGAMEFDGGDGLDLLTLDGSASTVGRPFQLGWIDSAALNQQGPAVTWGGAERGAWYEWVETLDVQLGSGSDLVQLDATSDYVQQVHIDGGAGSDWFELGSGPQLLSQIRGQVRLTAGTSVGDEDTLTIVENSDVAAASFGDNLLTPTRFVGQGLAGVEYGGFESLELQLNAADDVGTITGLTITGLTIPAGVDLGGGNDRVTLGTAEVPLAEAFPAGLSVEVGSGRNAVELFDSAHPGSATWGLTDTAISFAVGGTFSVGLSGNFDEVTAHLGQGGAIVSSSMTTATNVTLDGGAGPDSLLATAAAGGQVVFNGRGGADWLVAQAVPNGRIIFHGGDGTDQVVLDGSHRTDAWSVALDAGPLNFPGALDTDGRIGVPGYTTGIVYDAEQVEVAGGSGVENFSLTATADATESLKIGTGAGQDVIHIGAATAPLSQIHAAIDVRQTVAEDVLRVYSGSTAGATLSGAVTSTSITGLGLEHELLLDRLGQLGLFLGSASENLTISSLPQLVDTLVQVNLGAGDDTLRLGGADSGGVADLTRLSGFTLGMTGGDGNDALILDDHQSTMARNAVLITDVNVQNLGFAQVTTTDFESLDVRLNDLGNQITVWKMARPVTVTSGAGNDTFQIASMTAGSEWPLVIQAGDGADVLNLGDAAAGHDTIAATIRFYGGSGDDHVNLYDLDDGGRLEANGEAGTDAFYLDYAAGGQAVLDGGDGADVLQVGRTAEYHTIAADVSFYGRAGNDRAGVYQLRLDGSLRFDGGDDNDELNLGRTAGELARLDYVDGPVIFQGGAGEDRFDVDGGSGGSSDGSATFSRAVPAGGGEAMAWATWEPMAGGLFWAAEHGTITLGGPNNVVHLQATAPECQTLAITAAGDSEFRIEAQAGTTLDDLQGQITLTDSGYDDWLQIDNRASAEPLRAQLTDSTFRTFDAAGAVRASIVYLGFDGMGVYLGEAADALTVGSVRTFAAPVVFSLGGGDDLLEVGREGSLSRLSAIGSDLNIFAGDGRDTVAFYDADNPLTRSVTFSASTIDGLLPFAAQLGYVEQINAYLGARDDALLVTNPNWDLRVDTGGGTDTVHVNLLAAGKTAQVLGGPGDDDLYVGDGTTAAIPAGTVEFYGGDGNDEAYIYRAPSTAVFNYYGEGGDDKLVAGVVQPPGTDLTKRMLGFLDGAVCFNGGDGGDTLTLQQTISGNVVARFHQSLAPNGSVLGHLTGLDMDQGLWYDAESVSLNMGNTFVSTDQTEVSIDATGNSTQLLEVARYGGVAARFYVGTDAAVPLSAIHGQLKLSGGNSLLEVSEAGVNDDADALSVSWNGDAAVRRGLVTSRWFPGVDHQGMATIQITATDAADTIAIQSLQNTSVAVALLNVQTTDLVVLGQTIGASHQVTVNGVKPIYALPTAANNASGTMSAVEGASLNEAVSVRDVLADRNLATLVTDHGALTYTTAYTWQYLVAGALLQTIGFTATDTAGYQTQKLFDLAVTNVAPVANNDVYSVREQKQLSGNVLANDTNYNDHPTVRAIGNPSHGTLTLAADGSFAYTSTAGYLGDDTFTYRVNDGLADSNLATVTIHVTANHAPVAAADTLAKRLYLSIRPQDLLGNDTDADGDSLSVVILSQPMYGALVENGDGTWRYVPERWSEEWQVSFTYAAFDGLAQSAPATVTITPLPNARPEAMEDRLGTIIASARRLTAADLLANDSDAEGDALGVIIQSPPEHGTLTPDGTGAWLYQPAAGFAGWDSFLYSATDGMEQSLDTTVWIQVAPLLPAHTLAVNGVMTTPSGPLAGLSWVYAYNSLQDALDRAAALNADGDAGNDITAIWMAAGNYAPSRRRDSAVAQSESFALLSGVSLYGGFEGVEASLAERPTIAWYHTTLSGEVQGDRNEFNNAWTVVYADQVQDVVLDTLTIRDAYGWDGASFDSLDRWLGGGLYTQSSTLTLRNVNVVGNLAVGGGGGIFQAGGVLRLENVVVEDNATWLAGGGVSHVAGELYVTDSVVRRNRADGGGGLYLTGGTASLVRVVIGGGVAMELGDGNSAGEQGGGAWLAAPLTARMTNVTIEGNQASAGGGVYLGPATESGTATLTVANGRLAYNLAYRDGGGAVYNAGGTLTVYDTTISRNDGATGGGVFSNPAGGAMTTLFNSIVAENCENWPESGDVRGDFSVASAANLIGVAAEGTTGLVHGVRGNLVGTSAEPLAAGLDDTFHLTADSLAIGAGDSSLLPEDEDDVDGDSDTDEPLPLDAEGRTRLSAGGLSIGAFQHRAPSADAGGPYEVDEGGSVELIGWSSFDPPVRYEWDLEGWGEYSTQSTFSAEWIDGPEERIVWLRATSESGAVAEDSATITIRNVAPQVEAGPNAAA